MTFSYEKILNWPFDEVVETYAMRDSIVYALGLGFGFNPTDPDELKYVYEDVCGRFRRCRSYWVIPGHG